MTALHTTDVQPGSSGSTVVPKNKRTSETFVDQNVNARLALLAVVALLVNVLVVLFALTMADHVLPHMLSLPIPYGAIQTLRRPAGLYIEIWLGSAPVLMLTLPLVMLWRILATTAVFLVIIEYWLIWRWWR